MNTLKCINTGSMGNMYLLESNGEILVLELGVDYNTFLLNIDDIGNVVGAVYSHKHKDHYVPKMEQVLKNCGIEVLSCDNTQIGKRYKLGGFDIIPLPAVHNVPCQSYLIKANGENILFATDTSQLPKVNVKIDHFIVEVNYLERLREEAVLRDNDNALHLQGIWHNHHSLESAIAYFKGLSYKAKNIVAIHKSNSGLFSNLEVLQGLIPYSSAVHIASKGEKVNLFNEEI